MHAAGSEYKQGLINSRKLVCEDVRLAASINILFRKALKKALEERESKENSMFADAEYICPRMH